MRKCLMIVLTVTALMVTACSSKPVTGPGPAVAVLVDVSGSASGIHQRYLADFGRVLGALQGDERLYTFTIEANSSVAPMAFDLPLEASNGNAYTRRVTLKRQSKEASDKFTQVLETHRPERPGSAIIDGIRHAADALSKLPPEQERVVVVLSDMIEQSERSDFTGLTEGGVAPLIEQLQQQGSIPALKGARIYVAGITDASGALSASQVQVIRNFWERFFEAAGAHLEWYGPSLTEFRARV